MSYSSEMETEAKWAEIDLDALTYNMKNIRQKVGEKVKICAVVKANAYGHSVEDLAEIMKEAGADQFAVSSLDEALELRQYEPDTDILVLGNIPYGTEEISVEADLQHAVTSLEKARLLSEAAVKTGRTVRIHIKADTGMTRIGLSPDDEGADEAAAIAALPGVRIEGLFTHFATADERDKTRAVRQHRRFLEFSEKLHERGIHPEIVHAANSAAIMEMPETYHDMVRPGIILYGIYPSAECDRDQLDLRPVMSFKTRIVHVKTLKEEREISYGGHYTSAPGDQIGTIAAGYADGYTRAQSGRAEVLFRGKRVKVLGNICMDQCMIDLNGFEDVKIGEEVVLFGRQGDEYISADEVGERYHTIGYEVVCAVNRRVPRFFIRQGRVVNKRNYLEK